VGKLSELFCAVLCTPVVHNDKRTRVVLKVLVLGLVFVCLLRFSICLFFCFSLDYLFLCCLLLLC